MAIGWDDIQRMKRVEAKADELGFVFEANPYIYSGSWIGEAGSGQIYVKPKDECLPHYSRDTYFFNGSLEQIDYWLQGLEWARNYDQLLKLSDPKKRAAKEQLERNKQLMRTIKNGKLATGTMSGKQIVDIDAIVNDIVIYADDGGSGAGY
jgi:hypothetical protein